MSTISQEELDDMYPSMSGKPRKPERIVPRDTSRKPVPPSPYQVKTKALQEKYRKLLALDPNVDSPRLLKVLIQEICKAARKSLTGKGSQQEVDAAMGRMKQHLEQNEHSTLELQKRFIDKIMEADNKGLYHLEQIQKAQARHEQLAGMYPNTPTLTPLEKAAGGTRAILDEFDDDPPEGEADASSA